MELSLSDIISSKPFQRLKGKTQLFSPNTNDHYRNRMTHSLEVFAISNEIAKKSNFEIDYDKLGIIALCHDLGHTPFGHIGERTLNDILSGDDDLGGLLPFNSDKSNSFKQGFKHNIYSAKLFLRTFSNYDTVANDGVILDGIMKHTKPYYTDAENNPKRLDYGVQRIIKGSNLETIEGYYLKKEAEFIEGKIVALADEIAQRCSDFSDVMISKLDSFDNFKSLFNNQFEFDESDNYKNVESKIRRYFIDGVVFDNQMKTIELDQKRTKLYQDMESYTKDKIQGSYLIRTDDSKNRHIVRQIFKAFYKHPNQLDDSTLTNIYSDIYKSSVTEIKDRCVDSKDHIDIIKVANFVIEACELVRKGKAEKRHYKVVKNFLANIAYCIADMTDFYAKKKFNRLYNGEEE